MAAEVIGLDRYHQVQCIIHILVFVSTLKPLFVLRNKTSSAFFHVEFLGVVSC